MSVFSTIISQVFNGLQTGSVYALIALGYSMVYGIIMLLNFAHGDIIMVGAYIAWIMMSLLALPPIIGVVAAIAGCTILGVVIEKVAYSPLRKSPRLSLLITAIGISFLLENVAQLIMGAGAKSMPTIVSGPSVHLAGSNISFVAIVTIVVSVLSMAILTMLVQKTKMGKAMRAVSEDMGAAQLMGISVNRTISFTFAVGSGAGGYRRGPLQLRVSSGFSDNGRDAGPQGFCRCRAGRYRLNPRRDDRRFCHRSSGGARGRRRPVCLEGRRCFRHFDHCAAHQADRYFRPADDGKGLRGKRYG